MLVFDLDRFDVNFEIVCVGVVLGVLLWVVDKFLFLILFLVYVMERLGICCIMSFDVIVVCVVLKVFLDVDIFFGKLMLMVVLEVFFFGM